MCAADGTLWVCQKYPTAIIEATSANGAAQRGDAAQSATTASVGNTTDGAAKGNSAAAASMNLALLLSSSTGTADSTVCSAVVGHAVIGTPRCISPDCAVLSGRVCFLPQLAP